jgi:hypothetical protein
MDARAHGTRGAEANVFDGLPCLTNRADLAELFLRRLKRALLLRFYTDSFLSAGDRRLLDVVICSTLRDCQDAQVSNEARRLIADARSGAGLFRRPTVRDRSEPPWSI